MNCDDHVSGVLLGLAAGDRIGGPVRMVLMLAESLGECGVFDACVLPTQYLQKCLIFCSGT